MTTPDEAQSLLPVTPAADDIATARQICAQCAGDAGTINRPIAPRFLAGELDSHPSMIAALAAIAHTRESHRISHSLPGDVGRLEQALRDVNDRVAAYGSEALGRAINDIVTAALTPSALTGDAGEGE